MRNSRIILQPAALAAAVVLAIGASATAASARTVDATAFAKVGEATALRAGDSLNGMVPFTQPVHVQIALKMRNRDQLDAFIATAPVAEQTTGVRPELSSAKFMTDHAPTGDQVQAVVDFLTSAGFKNVAVSDNHLLVTADGTADAAQAAFQTSLARVQSKDGRDTFANTDAVHVACRTCIACTRCRRP
jgi:hypothetical protein